MSSVNSQFRQTSPKFPWIYKTQMKNFRTSVFETNSSSTHSVSIYAATKGLYDTIPPNEEGVIHLEGDDFGWEWQSYNDSLIKANYAAIFSRKSPVYRDMLIEVIKDHTGAKEVTFGEAGYIDHQSDLSEGGDAIKAFDTPVTLKNFLFHPESWLFTGNDNEGNPPNFYDVEFGILYTHEVSIEGCSLTEKVEEIPEGENLEEIIARIMGSYPGTRDYNSSRPAFEFINWDRKTPEGVKFNSLEKMSEGIITLYKTKQVYKGNGLQGSYLGEKILESKQLKFTINKL